MCNFFKNQREKQSCFLLMENMSQIPRLCSSAPLPLNWNVKVSTSAIETLIVEQFYKLCEVPLWFLVRQITTKSCR